MRYAGVPDGADAGAAIVIEAEPGLNQVEVPNGDFLLTADFTRLGMDLFLEGAEGSPILIRGYFSDDHPPSLVTADGATIGPELATSLAGSLTPAQYAQAAPAAGAEPIGKVTELTGTARVIRTDGSEEQLSLDDPVFQGDILVTDPDSTIGITFVDDTLFSLAGDGRLVLDQLIFNPGGDGNALNLSLVQGAFAFLSGKIAPADGPGMSIETPVATIGVRGTTGAGVLTNQLLISLLPDLVNPDDPGGLDIINSVDQETLFQIGNFIQVTSGGDPIGPPSAVPPEIQALWNLALISLNISFATLLVPEAGPEEEGNPESDGDPGLNQPFDFGEEFGNILGVTPEGDIEPLEINIDLDGLAAFLAADPNLLLLLELVGDAIGLFILADPEGILATPGADVIRFDTGVPVFKGGGFNPDFASDSGSSGNPLDGNVTHFLDQDDIVFLDGVGGANNLQRLFGEPTAVFGGSEDDSIFGGNDDDIIAGDGLFVGTGIQKGLAWPFAEESEHFGGIGGGKLVGGNDFIDGGEGGDTIVGDALVAQPGEGFGDIGFPNFIFESANAEPSGDDPDFLLNLDLIFFGSAMPFFANVWQPMNLYIELIGGDDTLLGGDEDDVVIGDGLLAIVDPDHHGEAWMQEDYELGQGVSLITLKGGSDLIFGGEGDDILVGDGIAKLPVELFPHSHDEEFYEGEFNGEYGGEYEGLSQTWLLGGDDLMFGNDGDDVMFGDGILYVVGTENLEYEGGEQCGPADPETMIVGGDDRMFGDSGNDLMVGDGIAVLGLAMAMALVEDFDGDLFDMFSDEAFWEDLDGYDDYVEPEHVETLVRGGNDWMVGGEGDDWMFGDGILVYDPYTKVIGGNDTMFGDSDGGIGDGGVGGNDTLFGGGGDDTISGDAGGDLGDENGADTSMGGDDYIDGGWGNDLLIGDAGGGADPNGDDVVGDGVQAGNDTIKGGYGDDDIYGDALDDVKEGAKAGDDMLYGGDGDDFIVGDAGGGLGSLLALGDAGNDMLDGGDGNDILYGDTPGGISEADARAEEDPADVRDPEQGDGGDDTLDGGQGDDLVFGGQGSDLGVWSDPEGDDSDYYDGGGEQAGNDSDGSMDTLRLTLTPDQYGDPAVMAEIAAYAALLATPGGDAVEFTFTTLGLTVVEWEKLELSVVDCGDRVFLVEDVYPHNSGNDAVHTGASDVDELITALGGNDDLAGDQLDIADIYSDDLITGDGGEDDLFGDSRNDLITKGGNDLLFGGGGEDILIGDTGNGTGVDHGEAAGNDSVLFGDDIETGTPSVHETSHETPTTGIGGNDKLFGGGDYDELYGDAFDDVKEGGQGGDDKLFGGEGGDTLFGDAGNSIYDGGVGGNDMLLGGEGDDTLFGDAGGAGFGSLGDFSQDEALGPNGTGGNDMLMGGRGDDILWGDGPGIHTSHAGHTEHDGGDPDAATTGNDSFVFSLAEDSGNDIIKDFETDKDTLVLNDLLAEFDSIVELDSAAGVAEGFSVADDGTDVTVTFGQGGGTVVIEAIGTGMIDTFADLDAAISLEITA